MFLFDFFHLSILSRLTCVICPCLTSYLDTEICTIIMFSSNKLIFNLVHKNHQYHPKVSTFLKCLPIMSISYCFLILNIFFFNLVI